ncbi:unnamed protein product [Microthlaspi erraticum]|uniref:hAT-like transposase RNase-H fold domain-containing protein n=1 Tax=Microthlaspi erraticum TaxID=1685480 RepID=A0A6D2IFL7_9BRAS|nr:unnamed protein product [Microthlaspi erraticum]
MVERCLLSWGITNVFTITVDNASANDVGIRFLKRRLKTWCTSLIDGEHLHMRCGARILNLVVRDGLDDNKATISRIRSDVRYVKSSPARSNKFKECLRHLKMASTAGVSLNVETRWNSTYLMLESALMLKRGFDMLALDDDKYVSELGKLEGVPTEADWEYAKAYTPILKYKLKHVSFIIRESYGGGENSIAGELFARVKSVLEQMFSIMKLRLLILQCITKLKE